MGLWWGAAVQHVEAKGALSPPTPSPPLPNLTRMQVSPGGDHPTLLIAPICSGAVSLAPARMFTAAAKQHMISHQPQSSPGNCQHLEPAPAETPASRCQESGEAPPAPNHCLEIPMWRPVSPVSLSPKDKPRSGVSQPSGDAARKRRLPPRDGPAQPSGSYSPCFSLAPAATLFCQAPTCLASCLSCQPMC